MPRWTITTAAFERLVEDALAEVPPSFRRRMTNVILTVEDEPRRGDLLGLYEGRPLPERSVSEGFTLPDKITVYRGPHLRTARDPEHLRRLVAETVWHEIGHYFGLDEREVLAAERRWSKILRRRGPVSNPARTRRPWRPVRSTNDAKPPESQ